MAILKLSYIIYAKWQTNFRKSLLKKRFKKIFIRLLQKTFIKLGTTNVLFRSGHFRQIRLSKLCCTIVLFIVLSLKVTLSYFQIHYSTTADRMNWCINFMIWNMLQTDLAKILVIYFPKTNKIYRFQHLTFNFDEY